MKITKHVTIEASADKVWKVFAHDFDTASEWMASVPKSYGKNVGQQFEGAKSSGRVCELDANPDGIKASERFLAYDETNKTCTVEVSLLNTPALVPILRNVLNFSVKESGQNQSAVTWIVTPQLKPFASLLYPLTYPLIKFGLGMFMGQITGELKYFVENGEPHPRKVKAVSKMKLATNE